MPAQNHPADLITLTRWVLQSECEARQVKEVQGDLTILLTALQTTCKFIESNVRKARLADLIGWTGAVAHDPDHPDQKPDKMNDRCHEIMVNCLRSSGMAAVLVSEQEEEAILIKESPESNVGHYCVVFDPLDGSSNIDAGVNIGTIFGIYAVQPGSQGSVNDVLRPGKEMVAAGYCMYGSSANLVLTTGQGVNGFTLDNALGEFILTHPDIQTPSRGKLYSINEGNAEYFNEPTLQYLKLVKNPPDGRKPYSARYIGSMVADVHRTLLYGGIFCYPADQQMPNGKLRLLYEAFPLSFLMEQAGGKSTSGTQRILDIQPQGIHSRTGIFLGSKQDVEEVESLYQSAV